MSIAFFRTAGAVDTSDLNNQVFINIEAHSIAFTALYFWVIPLVILGSVIGVSQTKAAIPRILKRFQAELPSDAHLPYEGFHELDVRTFQGGIYSWQPAKYQCPTGTINVTNHNHETITAVNNSDGKRSHFGPLKRFLN